METLKNISYHKNYLTYELENARLALLTDQHKK